jgi:hypothetical protein
MPYAVLYGIWAMGEWTQQGITPTHSTCTCAQSPFSHFSSYHPLL